MTTTISTHLIQQPLRPVILMYGRLMAKHIHQVEHTRM